MTKLNNNTVYDLLHSNFPHLFPKLQHVKKISPLRERIPKVPETIRKEIVVWDSMTLAEVMRTLGLSTSSNFSLTVRHKAAHIQMDWEWNGEDEIATEERIPESWTVTYSYDNPEYFTVRAYNEAVERDNKNITCQNQRNRQENETIERNNNILTNNAIHYASRAYWIAACRAISSGNTDSLRELVSNELKARLAELKG